jgi:hypothetical protein
MCLYSRVMGLSAVPLHCVLPPLRCLQKAGGIQLMPVLFVLFTEDM